LKTHQIRRADRTLEWLADPSNFARFKEYLRQDPTLARRLTSEKAAAHLVLLGYDTRLLPEDAFERAQLAVCLQKIGHRRDQDIQEQDKLLRQLGFAATIPYALAVELLPTKVASSGGSKTPPRSVGPALEDLRGSLMHAEEQTGTTSEQLPQFLNRSPLQVAMIIIASWLVIWVLWSMATHGGLSLHLMGIDVQRRDGTLAGPLRCGLRTFIVWLPFFALLLLSVFVQNLQVTNKSVPGWIAWVVWWLAVMYLAACAVGALVRPRRGLHDKWTGVYLMPR
jgi:hypothetical protein